jgi:ATP-binding cassette subfamily C (CFTR/MRP) protein 1
VKYYAWERPFINVVDKAREAELAHLRKFLLYKAIGFLVVVTTPMVSAVLTFLVYVLQGGTMTPLTAFTTLALLYVIRFPVTTIPLSINAWIQLGVALGRLEKFFLAKEVDHSRIELTYVLHVSSTHILPN